MLMLISHHQGRGNSQTLEQLLQSLDYAGVDKALAWLQPPYLREIDEANQYIYQAMQNHPDRILGFGWVDPNLGVSKALDMAKSASMNTTSSV